MALKPAEPKASQGGTTVAQCIRVTVRVHSATVVGVEACAIEVEVVASLGLPGYHLVGLPTLSVQEGRVRIRAALSSSGFQLPPRKVTVNLAPADQRKDGAAFDLPIALGVLAAYGELAEEALADRLFVGELSLDGRLRPVRGALPTAAFAARAGLRDIIVPQENQAEAALVAPGRVIAASTLGEVVAYLRGGVLPLAPPPRSLPQRPEVDTPDLAEVRGQARAKMALLVAAAGGHHLLLLGPPGAGKSMLARRLPGLLPELVAEHAVETLAVYSVAGALTEVRFPPRPPFRAPHHTISPAGLVGGGSTVRPGEITLAHNGVLFLDELPEFNRAAIDALREPLEEGRLTVARARGAVTFPARFQLVAAANPCPCGYYGSEQRTCRCSLELVGRYRARVSGPILDRIDLHVQVEQPSFEELRAPAGSGETAPARVAVLAARERQARRLRGSGVGSNGQLTARLLSEHCRISTRSEALLGREVRRGALGARAVARVLRVARTIADLRGHEAIAHDDVAEAVTMRRLDAPPGPAGLLDSYAPPSPLLAGTNPGKQPEERTA